jgi:hypothetical protein
MLNKDERSGPPNNDLTHWLFLAFLQQVSHGRGPYRRAALTIRYASGRAARDFGKSAAENSDETGRKQQPVCRLVVKLLSKRPDGKPVSAFGQGAHAARTATSVTSARFGAMKARAEWSLLDYSKLKKESSNMRLFPCLNILRLANFTSLA